MTQNNNPKEPDLMSDENGSGDLLSDDQKFQILLKKYETVFETRKLEIELFWRRSLFSGDSLLLRIYSGVHPLTHFIP
jgi:hypothetical protein